MNILKKDLQCAFIEGRKKNILRIEEEQTTYKKHFMIILKVVDILLFCAPLCVFSFVEPNPYICRPGQKSQRLRAKFFRPLPLP
jgi:hypothetical protein